MEITKREILFSCIIISIMIGFGILISRPIVSSTTERALNIISSVQINDSTKFDYIRRTNVGNFLAEGDLITIDPVSISDIKGVYSKIEKTKEEYTMHTRVVTTTDSKGHTHSHTETYWSWDVVKRWKWEANKVKFLGVVFTPREIGYKFRTHYQETIDPKEGLFATDVRYKYYTCPIKTRGVLMGVANNKTYNNLNFIENFSITQIVNKAESKIKSAPIVFWVLWLLFTFGIILLFYYFENKWLYGRQREN